MTTSTNLPSLPVEVWARVLQSLPYRQKHDLLHLWITCRSVSRFFKDEIEYIFRKKHLSRTRMSFQRDNYEPRPDESVFSIYELTRQCDWIFSHVSPDDKNIAIFVGAEEYLGKHKEAVPRILPSIIEERDLPDRLYSPQHTVQIRREFNDTELLGLNIDYEKLELSLNWRELYCNFFAEEKLITTIMHQIQDEMDRVDDVWEASRLEARRLRVRRQFREKHDIDRMLAADEEGLNSLMMKTQRVGMEDFSDDEDEENQVTDESSDTDSELDSDDEDGLMGEEDMSGEGATNDGPDLNELTGIGEAEGIPGIEEISD
ncbi:MAG: hypothetical protein M1835_007037 [Candelina submexicana]|nr:MAG: hypothetical protein M1835_007037 [Candelina submexicana]